MKSVTLPEFIALNEQLAALAAAEIPLVGIPGSDLGAVQQSLHDINTAVSQHATEGLTVPQSLQAAPNLPRNYRTLVQTALQGEERVTAFAGLQRISQSADSLRRAVNRAFVYPAVLAAFAYLGLILFCWYLVPALENLYAEMQLPVGMGLRVLQIVRDALPYWIAIPPLALGVAIVLWQFRQRSTVRHPGASLAWVPGMQRVEFARECSVFADSLANLLAAGTSFAEALPVAADIWTGRSIPREVVLSAEEDTSSAARLPPFLHWALFDSEPAMPREHALRLAAKLYFESVRRQSGGLRTLIPLVITFVFGGGITFLYALALFVPVAQLLRAIAS